MHCALAANTRLPRNPLQRYGLHVNVCFLATIVCLGCGPSSPEAKVDAPPDAHAQDSASNAGEPRSATDLHAAGKDVEIGASTFEPARTPSLNPLDDRGNSTRPANSRASMAPIPGSDVTVDQGIVGQQSTDKPFRSPLTIAPTNQSPDAGAAGDAEDIANNEYIKRLREDLKPSELIDFLSAADQDMQLIHSGRAGITDQQKARAEMNRIAKRKLEVARRLQDHPDADAAAKGEGARGELQALSHLAAQGDLKSAEALESLATENLESSDQQLAAESRIVLIGFAIEALENGKPDAAKRVVELVQQIGGAKNEPDVPAMMMMGHARQLLAQYGHIDDAAAVRQRILDLYAGSADPQIAKMAAQLAGNVRFDTIEKLRNAAIDGQDVTEQQWRSATEALIDEAADLVTVQYLAGAALELEATDHDDLAGATYEILQQRFDDPGEATGREVILAIGAREARQNVIGRTFDPDLPSIIGSPMPIAQFQGKIILMPFWATGFPESLQVIPLLQQIQADHPDDVIIVGMNLDPAGTRVEEFEPEKQLGFRSYRSVSSPTEKVANPVVARFGMVSMPFVAILDQDAKVVAIDFTGRKLRSTVEQLLNR
ncbi:MAG: TlpA family protein disulfide reductase [Pirellulaceae bacterium]|nr:TlpA family protein disulfide reductase [Pirellulaceae bacterium]